MHLVFLLRTMDSYHIIASQHLPILRCLIDVYDLHVLENLIDCLSLQIMIRLLSGVVYSRSDQAP